jgi:hypothetical protein
VISITIVALDMLADINELSHQIRQPQQDEIRDAE